MEVSIPDISFHYLIRNIEKEDKIPQSDPDNESDSAILGGSSIEKDKSQEK